MVAPACHDAGIDYELFLDCVHCGLCTSACPTYVELGDENDSPRGRIYLMRAVTDGRLELTPEVHQHLDLCLDCRACESACPSGVQYGKLIEPFRFHLAQTIQKPDNLGWLQRFLVYHITPYAWRMKLALAPARWLQWSGLDSLLTRLGFFQRLPASFRQLHDILPPLRPHPGRLPELLPAEGKRRARVALFTGCAGDAFFPETTLATARVLQHNGCEVWIPRGQVCCGALHYHGARPEPARRFALTNCRVFGPALLPGRQAVDAIIVNAAGCGALLKDYEHVLAGEWSPGGGGFRSQSPDHLTTPTGDVSIGAVLAARTRDVSEFLVQLGPVRPAHPLALRAVYHDACHLCHGQQIRQQPRQLLKMIPGLELVPLAESEICCGAAGSYNLTQPAMSARLGERKARHILAAEAQAVLTSNVGCILQIQRYLRNRLRDKEEKQDKRPDIWVGHLVDALWMSYSGGQPPVGKQG